MRIATFNYFNWNTIVDVFTPLARTSISRRCFVTNAYRSAEQDAREKASEFAKKCFGANRQYSAEARVANPCPRPGEQDIITKELYEAHQKSPTTKILSPDEINSTFKMLDTIEQGSY